MIEHLDQNRGVKMSPAESPEPRRASESGSMPVGPAPGRSATRAGQTPRRASPAEMYFDADGPMSDASERFGPLVFDIGAETNAQESAGARAVPAEPDLADTPLSASRMARGPGLVGTGAVTKARRTNAKALTPTPLEGVVRPAFIEAELARILWAQGGAFSAHAILGAHTMTLAGVTGTRFAVWAPTALRVSVIGEFNDWHPTCHELLRDGGQGVWSGFIPGASHGMLYKYRIQARDGRVVERADPFARCVETPPRTASVVWDAPHAWTDDAWLAARKRFRSVDSPISVYQVHLGSWMRVPEEGNRSLTYHEIAPRLARHAKRLGFTHVELFAVLEHPIGGEARFETSGYFTPTGRHGTPEGLMHLIDVLHREGLGVILAWKPTGFANNDGALASFDGSPLYEGSDAVMAHHPDGHGATFDLSKGPVRSFLLSSALHWIEAYHIDGLRVCDIATLLYRDHHRSPGQWTPNARGGPEYDEGIGFLRTLSDAVALRAPGVMLIADDVSCHPGVTRPTTLGGLGFTAKSDHRWSQDLARYFSRDPIHRSYHHNEVTFRATYAGAETWVAHAGAPEIVQPALFARMFGDQSARLANLRCLLALAFTMPGKKSVFMGTEFGQPSSWDPGRSLDWHLHAEPGRVGLQRLTIALNAIVRKEPSLHAAESTPEAITWVESEDRARSLLSFIRQGPRGAAPILVIGNFTPVPRPACRFGVPRAGNWRVVLNTSAKDFGGPGSLIPDAKSHAIPSHSHSHSVTLDVPPLSVLVLRRE